MHTMANPDLIQFLETLHPDPMVGRLGLHTKTVRRGTERTYWCFNLAEVDRRCSKLRRTRRLDVSAALHVPGKALAIAKKRRGRATEGTIRGYSGVSLLIIDEAAWVPDDHYASVRPMLAVSGGIFPAL